KDTPAAEAVDRLDDHLPAELVEKTVQLDEAPGNEGTRNQLGEAQHIELLVGITQAGRVVDEQRTARQLYQLRRVKILDVDGRVLTQERDVEGRETHLTFRDDSIVIPLGALELDPLGRGADLAPSVLEILLLEAVDLVTTALALEHECQARVVADNQGVD